jgi:hypothetical protein
MEEEEEEVIQTASPFVFFFWDLTAICTLALMVILTKPTRHNLATNDFVHDDDTVIQVLTLALLVLVSSA